MWGGMHGWQGGMHGCWGVCGCGGHAWLAGGHAWLVGACMVAGGMHGCGGHAWLAGGACIVGGGMCGCRGACIGYDEIQSMSGRYASYWNAFLWYDGSILHDLTIQFHYIFSPTKSFHKIFKKSSLISKSNYFKYTDNTENIPLLSNVIVTYVPFHVLIKLLD